MSSKIGRSESGAAVIGLERVVHVIGGPAVTRRAVDHGEVERLVVGTKFDEEAEQLIDHAVGVRLGPVALVNHDNGAQAEFERFAEHEACLGHGAFEGVDDEHAAVGHAEHAFDFAAKVGVARRVDDVDAVVASFLIVVIHRAVFGKDRDAPLTLERVGVHDQAVLAALELVELGVPELAGLAKELVNQGGFPVVDVGDDGDVSEVVHSLDC